MPHSLPQIFCIHQSIRRNIICSSYDVNSPYLLSFVRSILGNNLLQNDAVFRKPQPSHQGTRHCLRELRT